MKNPTSNSCGFRIVKNVLLVAAISYSALSISCLQNGQKILSCSCGTEEKEGSGKKHKTAFDDFGSQTSAYWRAIASMDPDPGIRNPDYLAIKLVDKSILKKLAPLTLDYSTMRTYFEGNDLCIYFYFNAMYKNTENILKNRIRMGITQVVVLGAGLDSRAYRYRDLYPHIKFYEVDLPHVQEQKKEAVIRALGSLPENVIYVPIDFNRETLGSVLNKAGYDKNQKTFFIWEAVTFFITKEATEGVLRFIADNSAPGSSVVFDFVLQSVIDGSCTDYGFMGIVKMASYLGLDYITGFDEKKIEPFIHRCGLRVLSVQGPGELTKRYLVRRDGTIDGRICEPFRIVHAAVVEGSEK
jgi:methyltransferase (TIGR00027 family)